MRDPLVSLLVRNAAYGIGVGWAVVALMLIFDLGGLAGLIFASDVWALAMILLLGAFAVTFGSVQMGIAIMTLPREEQGSGGARSWYLPGRIGPSHLRPVKVRASRR
jgi:hypothetical protein